MNNDTPQPLNDRSDPGREALGEALRVSFRVLLWSMILIAFAYLLSGIFIVREHERAYVLVFGRVSGVGTERIKNPGLHWTWPKPIAEIIRIPAERIQTMEIDSMWYEELPVRGFQTRPRAASPALRPLRDGYLLTGDANIIHARWGVRYTIRDPEIYLFHITHSEQLLDKEVHRAATLVAQQWAVDRALRTDIEAFRADVANVLRDRLLEQPIGLDVHRLDLLSITPPLQVAAAFESVIEAEQDRSRDVSAARAYAARIQNETQGQASQLLSQARVDRQRIVSEAEADADFFLSVLDAFRDHPKVITQTLWQDRIRTIMDRVDRQHFMYERQDGKRELRLQIGR